MKKRIIMLIATIVLTVAAVALVSCAGAPPYKDYDKDGYTVSVRFEANGGDFAGNGMEVSIMDVFHKDASEIQLLDPADEKRGESTTRFEIQLHKHKLNGWYVKSLAPSCKVVDKSGNTVSKDLFTGENRQPWDFELYRLVTDKGTEYSSSEPVLVLEAGWQVFNTFEFLIEDADGSWTSILDEDSEPTVFEGLTLNFPTLDLEFDGGEYKRGTGAYKMGKYPEIDGKTFVGAYLDPDCTIAVTGALTAELYSELTGNTADVIKIYTKYREGEWYQIYDEEQLDKVAETRRCYEIMADLDFTGTSLWPFDDLNFSGTIEGNGHTIKGVAAKQRRSTSSTTSGGIFRSVGKSAVIRNVTFENASYLVKGSLKESVFGLFTGEIKDGAVVEGITFTGECTLILSNDFISGDIKDKFLGASPIMRIFATVGDGTAQIVGGECIKCKLETSDETYKCEIVDGVVTVTKLEESQG